MVPAAARPDRRAHDASLRRLPAHRLSRRGGGARAPRGRRDRGGHRSDPARSRARADRARRDQLTARDPAMALGLPPRQCGRHARAHGRDHLPNRLDARRADLVGGGARVVTVAAPYPRVSAARVARAYFELTKPRIVSLVLFTGLPALVLAGGHSLSPRVFWGALVGIALSAASAAAFNHYFDRDIDALMVRTRSRPLPAGVLPPSAAAALALTL